VLGRRLNSFQHTVPRRDSLVNFRAQSVCRKFITVCSFLFRTKETQCPQGVSGRQQPFGGWCLWE
jgi:hypothetical protein